jgi:S-DNA-T family DNA segregation ATPase FtsK/SpoIIIE
MAKKSKQPSSKKITKNTSKGRKQVEITTLHPETKKWIIGVVLFMLAGISMLALFNLAGAGGRYILSLMQQLFGVLAFVFPLILVGLGYVILNKENLEIKPVNYVGITLFVIALAGLFHIFNDLDDLVRVASQGQGGGYVGLILSYPLLAGIGMIAGTLIVIALVVIGLLLSFNSSWDDLADKENMIGRMLASIQAKWYDLRYGNLNEEEDEEEEWEDEVVDDVHEGIEEDEADEVPEFTLKKIQEKTLATPTKEIISEKHIPELKEKKKVVYKKVDIPLDLLEESSGKAVSGNPIRTKEKIKATLESFNIPVEMGDVNVGPTVTQYELTPAEGVKLSRITALQDDLALALAAHPLRIEAPIPGKSAVGVEIPNTSAEMVRLKTLLQSKEFRTRKGNLEVALGKDVSGKAWTTPIDKMPHLLVAGATGSGKSVCLNTIIVSLLYQNSPETLRFIMVDPKKVELSAYADIPHLLTPVITDTKKTVNALKWAVAEMERRYTLLQKASKRNIETYNEAVSEDKLPYIVFVIDEMADLMVSARAEVETLIIRLAQMSRAIGIHLVLATQRPSVDVITGLIKANVPTRIAFAVASAMDSRTILDATGAEKLVGKGDMLFSNPQYKKPVRIQGVFLSEEEVHDVCEFIKDNAGEPDFVEGVTEKQTSDGGVDFSDPNDGDELFDDAKEIVVMSGKASTSFLQRKLKIGYSRAARIMDLLEDAGVVGPQEGSKSREIFVSKESIASDEISGFDIQPAELQPSYEEYEEAFAEAIVTPETEEEVSDTEADDEELEEVLEDIEEIDTQKKKKLAHEEEEEEDEDDWV